MKDKRQLLRVLVDQLRYLKTVLRLPASSLARFARSLITLVTGNSQVSDLIKYVFLGSVIETGRKLGQALWDRAQQFFVVEATFNKGDFAYDWITRYLADQKIWSQSRIFRVVVENPINSNASADWTDIKADIGDGKPRQLYMPTPGADPVFFRWQGYWISVTVGEETYSSGYHGRSAQDKQPLMLRVWSRNRKIMDDLVEAARSHYFASERPPRQLYELPDVSDTIITVRFSQSDRSYDWMLAWIQAHDHFHNATHLVISTKPSDLPLDEDTGKKALLTYRPARGSKQRIQWRDHWFQFDIDETGGSYNYSNSKNVGFIDVTLHSTKRDILTDLVIAAKVEYTRLSVSNVNVHLPTSYGSWETTVTRSRRALQSIILPPGVKERLVADIEQFVEGEDWYNLAGVPHRRGYLFYGDPGTGKSSTIHAIASELSLEIYYIQLASLGLDDSSLRRLFSEAPAKCIILLEDIDCAFPPRDEKEQEEDSQYKKQRSGGRTYYSSITLSGLLNCLDSVISEEGRIVFATTNYIEDLDSALIRPGRMDMKVGSTTLDELSFHVIHQVEFKLATHHQLEETFRRFFTSDLSGTELSPDNIGIMATKFAGLIPEYRYSLAQIQMFMIPRRASPERALDEIQAWMDEQEEERCMIEERKRKKREEIAKARQQMQADATKKDHDGSTQVANDAKGSPSTVSMASQDVPAEGCAEIGSTGTEKIVQ